MIHAVHARSIFYLLVIMFKLPVDIPMGKAKPKSIHHGRRSLDKRCLTITTVVDSKDLLPNYLTPSKGSCHDKCKYGSRHKSEFGSSCKEGKEVLLTSKRSPWIAKPVVDSIARRTNEAKRPRQINPEPWRVGRVSEFVDPMRYRHIGRRIDGGVKRTGKLGKEAQAVPEVSRTVKSSSYRSMKKQKTVAKARSKKCVEEHVQEMVLHVVEEKDESEGNEAIGGTTCTDSSCSSKGAFEKEVIDETSDPDNSPRKLKFEKGETIDIQQVGNSTSGLNFIQHVRLTKRVRETEPENRGKSIVVKLRHQTVADKQGSHKRSYNSLIEDTTHSLVWLNKSKVKALVNAFECVVSLHNSQPRTVTY